MKVGDVFKLSTEELRSLVVPDSLRRRFILNVVFQDWNANETPPTKTRAMARRLLPLTLSGEPLANLHPGNVTVWRGGVANPGKVESYSTNRQLARGFGKVTSLQLTPSIPALSLDALWGVGRSENEVIVMTPDLHEGALSLLRSYVRTLIETAIRTRG